MKLNWITVGFALLILLICMGSAVAGDGGESDSVSIDDNSSNHIISSNMEEDIYTNSEDDSELSNSDEIIVNDWNELKHYCYLTDKNYNLRLKENTNYYPEDPNLNDYQIVINNNVTIKGSSGAYIGDDSSNPRIIKYTPIKVNDKSGIGITLENITFKWINTKYQNDGIVLTLAGDVNNTIRNCLFTGITTNVGHSSIIHVKYGELLMDNCSFINCTTDYGCISVYCPDDSNANVFTGARMYLRDSYFEGNYAKTEPGCINNCGLLIVNNTTFSKNRAFWWAGAIHTHSSANTTLYDCDFIDNVAGWNGGALYTYSYLQIYNCSFIGNNCTTNNGGGAIGAWTYGHAPFLHIEDSVFKYNENLCWGLNELSTSGTGRGGAISFSGSGLIEVFNSTFVKNSASIGTAISVTSSGYGSPMVKIIENSFVNHTRIGDALVIKLNANSNCEIRDNYYSGNTFEFSRLKLTADDPVNGMVTFHIDAELNNPSSFDTDILEKSGYAVYIDGIYKTTVFGKTFTLDFKTIGPANVYVVPLISTSRTGSVLAGVERTYIYLSQSSGSDSNNGLSRNYPVKTLNKSIELARAHGNIIIMDGTFKEKGLTIDYDLTIRGEDNIAISSLRGNVFTITEGDVSFTNIVFKNCKLSNTGAAKERLINQENKGYLTLNNCSFENMEYRALISSQGTVDAENLKFYNNYAALIHASSVRILDSVFMENTVDKSGYESLLYVTSKFEASNLVFNKNSVEKGCVEIKSGIANLRNCNFTLNTANSKNAASCIYVSGGSVSVKSSIMMDNVARLESSSIIYISGGSLSLQDSIILNNSFNASSIIVLRGSALMSVVCNNNWWGDTMDDLTKPQLDSRIRCINRFVLNVSSSKQSLVYIDDEMATITFDLNYVIDINNNISYNPGNLPQITLNLNIINGKEDYTNISLVNSKNTIPFQLKTFDDGSVTAKFNNVQAGVILHAVKKDPNFKIHADNITVGETANITVSTDLNISSYEISVDEKIYSINFTDGVGVLLMNNLKMGLHEINLTCPESATYISANLSELLEVYGFDSNASIEINDSYYDEDVKIIITTPGDASGIVYVTVGDEVQNKTIDGDKIEFTFKNLSAGEYDVAVNYTGDEKYYPKNLRSKLNVLKYNSTVSISLSEVVLSQDVDLTAIVLPDAKGNVTFTINGETHVVNITDAKAVYTIKNIPKGDYKIKVTYNGDKRYQSCENTTRFNVAMLESTVTVDARDITYGENATFTVTVCDGATGNVTVIVDGENKTVKLNNSNAVVYISNLSVGVKNVSVIYHGDEDYLNSVNSTVFTITKAEPEFTVSANSAMVGEHIIIHIDFNNLMRGNFTITLGDISVDRLISKWGILTDWQIPVSLNPDEYEVKVRYNGDNNFNTGNNSTTFTISEYPPVQVSNDGINTENTDCSGFEATANGEVLFTIDLKENISTNIVVDSEGNIYFAANTTIYAYTKTGELIWNYSTSNMDGNEFSGLALGRNTLIASMPGDRLYFINITSGKEDTHSNMAIASSEYSPIIDGNYTVFVSSEKQISSDDYYLVIISYDNWQTSNAETVSTGNSKPLCAPVIIDEKHVGILTEKGFAIIDIETDNVISNLNYISPAYRPVVGLGGLIYTFGENSIICISPDGEKLWQTHTTGGTGRYLTLSDYLYSVNANGTLYKYDLADGEESLVYDFKEKISSNILIDAAGKMYLGSESGIFYALDSEGKLLWKVSLNGRITANPVLDEEGSIYVTVNSSKIIKLTNNPVLSDSSMSYSISNITVGDDLTVEVEFDRDITGQITFKINDEIFNISSVTTENHIKLTVVDLKIGNYTFQAIYSGDNRFKQTSFQTGFSVLKHNTVMHISAPGEISIGQTATVEITLPEGAWGAVVMKYNDVVRTIPVNGSKIRADIANLKPGDTVVTFTYNGNENFTSCANSAIIHVSVIKITGSDVNMAYTSGAKYTVRLTVDGKAVSGKTITFTVNGKKLTASTDKNGYASVKIDLPPKSSKYTVHAEYQGVKTQNTVKVNSILSAKNLKVKKSAKSLKIKVTLKKVNGKYFKSKKITLKFNGKKYNAKTGKKGVATFKITKKVIKKLKAGKKYTYQVTYLKDTVKKSITVKK